MPYLTPRVIANEALLLLSDRVVAPNAFSRNSQALISGSPKIGSTVKVRRRGVGVVTNLTYGQTPNLSFNNLTETDVDVSITNQLIMPIGISDADLSLNIADFSRQILEPQMNEMAQQINREALKVFKTIPTVAGLSGSAPAALHASIADWALVDKTLNDQQVPTTGRMAVVSTDQWAQTLSIPNLTRVNEAGSNDALRRAQTGPVLGMDLMMSQGIDTTTFTSGTMTSCLVNAASGVAAGSTSIVFDGANGATVTLKKYDIITIAGYGNAVVAADVTASSSAGTITIFDPLTKDVADNAAITVYDGGGNTRQNHGAAFHPSAIEFVAVPGEAPLGGAVGEVVTLGNVSIRVIYGFGMGALANQMVFDCYIGTKLVQPALASQIVKNI